MQSSRVKTENSRGWACADAVAGSNAMRKRAMVKSFFIKRIKIGPSKLEKIVKMLVKRGEREDLVE